VLVRGGEGTNKHAEKGRGIQEIKLHKEGKDGRERKGGEKGVEGRDEKDLDLWEVVDIGWMKSCTEI
jgi:hypothetical protein